MHIVVRMQDFINSIKINKCVCIYYNVTTKTIFEYDLYPFYIVFIIIINAATNEKRESNYFIQVIRGNCDPIKCDYCYFYCYECGWYIYC